ncbi:hypothetical protein [Xanthobacter autotrophicus]|uniref:hypothetical protein n=1 Tax=Xanthobacter autotrophicus TaxID=280 RepID=UPI00372B9388
MNRIVREHYPVEKLPEDLREGLAVGQTVTITVEEEAKLDAESFDAKVADILSHPQPMTLREVRALVGPRNVTSEEAVARIRALRDEWD